MKRITKVIALLLMAVMVFAACAPATPAKKDEPTKPTAKAEEKTEEKTEATTAAPEEPKAEEKTEATTAAPEEPKAEEKTEATTAAPEEPKAEEKTEATTAAPEENKTEEKTEATTAAPEEATEAAVEESKKPAAAAEEQPAEESKTEEAEENKTEETAAPVEELPPITIGLATDVGGVDDKSFNQGTWEGVLRYAKDHDLPEDKYQYVQATSDADYIPQLTTYAEMGLDLIVAPGFLFNSAITQVAGEYPDQKFLFIDDVSTAPNVLSAVFAEHEGSFLVGVAAALKAQEAGKDTVGFVGGMDFDTIRKFEAGYEQGVHAVAPDMKVLIEYVGGFDKPEDAQTIATKMYDAGAYVIYPAAGSSGNGVIKEAKDRAINGEDVWVIGVDRDQYEEGIYEGKAGEEGAKSVILTSMVKGVNQATYQIATEVAKGEFKGGIRVFYLKDGGADIPAENPNLTEDWLKTIHDYRDQIISGEIKVDPTPERVKAMGEVVLMPDQVAETEAPAEEPATEESSEAAAEAETTAAETTAPAEEPATEESSEAATEAETTAAEAAAPTEDDVVLHRYYGAPHGTKAFARFAVLTQGDTILAARIDEFQYGSPDDGWTFLMPEEEGETKLFAKRTNSDIYSKHMKDKAQSTVSLLDNYKAIEAFVAGKTVKELEDVVATAKEGEALDAISGATLVDGAGYVKGIIEAAKSEDYTVSAALESVEGLEIKAAQRAKGKDQFGDFILAVQDGKIVLASIDELQYMGSDSTPIPNGDNEEFAKNFPKDMVLASKLVNQEAYSKVMAENGGATLTIAENYKGIESFVLGKTAKELQKLVDDGNFDAISEATVKKENYMPGIVDAANEGAKKK